jgi:hypothetical protein
MENIKDMKFENFNLYVERKVESDNDYKLLDPKLNIMVPTDCAPYTEEEEKLTRLVPILSKVKMKKIEEEAKAKNKPAHIPHVRYIKKELINRYHPDNIDSRKFWGKATEYFPHYSIAGGQAGCKSPEECNSSTLKMAYQFGPLGELDTRLHEQSTATMLEIGPGHGGLCYLINERHPLVNYHAIDVNPLFDWPSLHQTDGKTIPTQIPDNLDIVYSFNVFQHLSKSQRTQYYHQIWEKLKMGGTFYFGMFLRTEANKDWPVWGVKDFKGRYYCHFFKQFTEIDTSSEIWHELQEIGFKVDNISKHIDRQHYHTFKCTKIN